MDNVTIKKVGSLALRRSLNHYSLPRNNKSNSLVIKTLAYSSEGFYIVVFDYLKTGKPPATLLHVLVKSQVLLARV